MATKTPPKKYVQILLTTGKKEWVKAQEEIDGILFPSLSCTSFNNEIQTIFPWVKPTDKEVMVVYAHTKDGGLINMAHVVLTYQKKKRGM